MILISKESIIILEVMQLIICVNFFAICKNTEWILSKKNKKDLKKRLVKGIKIFLNKRQTKIEKIVAEDIKVFLKIKGKD